MIDFQNELDEIEVQTEENIEESWKSYKDQCEKYYDPLRNTEVSNLFYLQKMAVRLSLEAQK